MIQPACSSIDVEPADLTELLKAAAADANATIDAKSRQIKPTGELPMPSPLAVRTQATKQTHSYQDGRLQTPDNEYVESQFSDVCTAYRRTMLLGDLGSGKSTIAAKFVREQNERGSLTILAPCKMLKLQPNFLLTELVASVNRYMQQQVAPHVEGLDIAELLKQNVEVCIVFDGVDELSTAIAPHFLQQAAKLVTRWSSIQVVATGRPVELIGISYAAWQVCEVCRLGASEKRELLRNEFISKGASSADADRNASRCLDSLKNYPALDDVACTPLAIRIAHDRLNVIDDNNSPTLGDLLYDLARERLELWEQREGRGDQLRLLSRHAPSSFERIQLLGELAVAMMRGAKLSEEACIQIISERISGEEAMLASREAYRFFCESGFLERGESVEFIFEPFKQLCAAAALLARWKASPTDVDRVVVHWRVVSFAAALARRKNQLSNVEDSIRSAVKELLSSSSGVAPACYITNETKSPTIAEFTIEQFRDLGRRPLFWSSGQRQASSKAIAATIVLAGEAGFEWFFESYLNPRIPIRYTGSAVIDTVFRNWVALVKDDLTDAQRQKLSVMVNPFRAFDGMLAFLNKLVFLCPAEFTNREQMWHYAGHLGSSDFGEDSRIALTDAFAGPHKQLVNAILVERAKHSVEAALQYLRLNDDAVPPEIAYSIASHYSTRGSHVEIAEAVETCERFFGEERWSAILRWCLASPDQERRLPANAARLLYERGDRRFDILASGLLDGLHDGLKAPFCGEYLERLVREDRATHTRYIANSICNCDDSISGAHSGAWRIFLENLDALGDDAPRTLVDCTRSIGQFLLARYPDVRKRFRDLLRDPTYRNTFKQHLWDADPKIRLGVSMVLVIADPQHDAEAVLVALMSRGYGGHIGYHEWEEFFLSLDFGFSVQEYINSKLDSLNVESRALALAMLAKNGYRLSDKWCDELRDAQLETGRTVPSVDLSSCGPASSESFARYISTANNEIGDAAKRAADKILSFHFDKLSTAEVARCWLVLSVNQDLDCDSLQHQFCKLVDDEEYRNAIHKIGSEIEKQYSTAPLLLLAARAIEDSNQWTRVIWEVFCREGLSLDMQERCHGVFEFALTHPGLQDSIGQAAASLVSDERIDRNRCTDQYHWLVLLAATFARIEEGIIEDALRLDPIYGIASRGLVAILGRIPEGCTGKLSSRAIPDSFPRPAPSISRDRIESELGKASLESKLMMPIVSKVIESVVFSFTPTDALLEATAANGMNGKFIAQCLRYCFDIPQSLKDRAAIMSSPFLTIEQQTDRQRQALIAVQDRAFRSQISDKIRDEYLAELRNAQQRTGGWNHAFVFETFRIAGRIENGDIEDAFTNFAKYQTGMHQYLARELVAWLSGSLEKETQVSVLSAAKRAMQILDQHSWTGKGMFANQFPYAYLIFPLVVWRFENVADEPSSRVFARGMQQLIRHAGAEASRDRAEPLALIEPMLKLVSKKQLRAELEKLGQYPDATIRAFGRLMESLSDP